MVTFPFAFFTAPLLPLIMWITIRWIEEATSNGRAVIALLKLFKLGSCGIKNLQEKRRELHTLIKKISIDGGLPDDPEDLLITGLDGVNIKGEQRQGLFSFRRRAKKDWNEVLRLWDVTNHSE